MSRYHQISKMKNAKMGLLNVVMSTCLLVECTKPCRVRPDKVAHAVYNGIFGKSEPKLD